MADVFQRIIPANEIINGGVVVGANEIGTYFTTAPKIDFSVIVTQSGSLGTRFDDVRYYTGDSGVG
jgi:hypothetical protein